MPIANLGTRPKCCSQKQHRKGRAKLKHDQPTLTASPASLGLTDLVPGVDRRAGLRTMLNEPLFLKEPILIGCGLPFGFLWVSFRMWKMSCPFLDTDVWLLLMTTISKAKPSTTHPESSCKPEFPQQPIPAANSSGGLFLYSFILLHHLRHALMRKAASKSGSLAIGFLKGREAATEFHFETTCTRLLLWVHDREKETADSLDGF